MTVEHGMVYSFKLECLLATHDFSADTFKIALYSADADLTLSDVTAYTTTNELSASGYSAGGATISVATGFPKISESAVNGIAVGQVSLVDFDDVTFSSLVGAPRAALVYNSSKDNKAIAILDFGQTYNINGDLTITWPNPDAYSAIIKVI